MAAILDDVTGPQQLRRQPILLPYHVAWIKGFLTKATSFPNIETQQKPDRGGVPSTLSPLYLGGVSLLVRPRVKGHNKSQKIRSFDLRNACYKFILRLDE